MKKLALLFIAGICVLSACDNSKEKIEEAKAKGDSTATVLRDSIEVALEAQDSLIGLITEINDGMAQIKTLEKILSTTPNLGAESNSRREQIKADMLAIQEALQARRQKLADLEKKLKASNVENTKLTKAIESLKEQITTQETTIAGLRNELAAANINIAALGQQVDSLSTTVADVKTERDQAQQKSAELNKELNTCYYAVGSNKELKSHKILEKKFLGKTKIMQNDFEKSYFTTGDKSKLTEINLYSKKAKVWTNHPKGSYQIVESANGQKTLKITNPSSFWSLGNYLVVQTD